ncbi:NAD(P)H-dependent oxidoreductase [Adhaeribacter swui]|uniref:NAD(P)H-dependent oxidoreductase n=1 Tax=Adhaeribacter swui TaxID=2086471 RepID=A0A7G7GBC5_9BACT|nr:NADPH-dependent FMN reductase [Adhaeribacter swui]QNF34459.1 NAD(P)H-dependent oxidoreductase [Adhaeribacter swui]
MHIAILSTSVRTGRNSHRVGIYFKKFIEEKQLATADLIDLQDYHFPIFEERLRFMDNPLPSVVEFASRMQKAAGIIVITPEYNGGFPASLKNVIDLLSIEWKGKPTSIVTVSTGPLGGVLVYPSLVFSLWKKGVWVVPARYQVPQVQEAFDAQGNPADVPGTEKRTQTFLQELVWFIEARSKMANTG